MGDHYHLLLETLEPNLSQGMGRLNAVHTQWFNRQHGRVGHVLQGRYKAILVEKESHLLELSRYVVLNPVRAGMVKRVDQWPWGSYRATAGTRPAPAWLTTDWVLSQFGHQRRRAQAAYRRFVAEGVNAASPWQELRGQMYLGTEAFLTQMRRRVAKKGDGLAQVSRTATQPDRPTARQIVTEVAKAAGLRDKQVLDRKRHLEAFRLVVYLLRRVGNVPLKNVAVLAKVSAPRISQIQKLVEQGGGVGAAFPWAKRLLIKYKLNGLLPKYAPRTTNNDKIASDE